MKYTININQAGIAEAGLADHTDLSDWAILDYIRDWSRHPAARRLGDYAQIDYSHLLKEMPLLGINSKAAITKRLTRLEKLGLITSRKDKYGRKFIDLAQISHTILQ